MARGISLLSLLAALLVGGWLLTAQQSSPSGGRTTQAVAEARQAAAGISFQQAETRLEQFHALNGTYAGRRSAASASRSCVPTPARTASRPPPRILAGPGGTAAAGPC